MPKYVLRYELDLDLETNLIPVLLSQIKRLMVEIESNVYSDRIQNLKLNR